MKVAGKPSHRTRDGAQICVTCRTFAVLDCRSIASLLCLLLGAAHILLTLALVTVSLLGGFGLVVNWHVHTLA